MFPLFSRQGQDWGGIKRDKLNGTNGFLQNSAIGCGFLRESTLSCEKLHLRNAVIPRKSAHLQKISENLKNSEFGSVCPVYVTLERSIFSANLSHVWSEAETGSVPGQQECKGTKVWAKGGQSKDSRSVVIEPDVCPHRLQGH